MKAKTLLVILICAITVVGGISYYSIVPREAQVHPTGTQTMFQPPTATQTTFQPAGGLNVTIVMNRVPATFPTVVEVTSFIENPNSRSMDSVSMLQTMPEGLNLTEVYLARTDGTRSPYNPSVTPDGLSYPFNSTLAPKERIALIVLLQSTPAAVSGNFTTVARGTYDGKWVRSQGSAWIFVQPTLSTCQDWGTIEFGDFHLFSNVWGGEKEPHLQCMTIGPGAFGWNLSRQSPAINEWYQVIQPYYPEVIYGKNPWHALSTTNSLPVAVNSLKTLEVSLMVSMKPYTKYNFAFDIWITNNTESSSTHITDEIMIWLVWTRGLPGEYVADTLNDGYNIYEHRIYRGWNMIMTSPGEQHRYHQFTIKKQGVPSRINVLAFFDHLKKEKHDLRYLASVELGNEVWQGTGTTTITELRVDLETTRNLESSTLVCSANYRAREGWITADKSSPQTIDTRSAAKPS